MERRAYEELARVEERGWWFQGLHAALISAWFDAPLRTAAAEPALLDGGCGTGGLLTALKKKLPQACCYGLEIDPLAAAMARQKSGAPIIVGSVMALPLAPQALDAIFSADVLCHRGVEPRAALAALLPCLKPGGIIVLNLPAYPWLFSGHDRAVDNARRFTAREVRALLNEAGFASIRIAYWNTLLFPLMVVQRLTRRAPQSDVALLPTGVERLFAAIVRLEAQLARGGLRLPFGGSILASAVKPRS